ncbi:MAG: aspartate aminotransferase [Lentisphaerae bacterium RIFOXYC12_FULL_60_16]|nr:MAG: aspartate aminotransferase [Lentisphaerae bacterium RIFOXYC12_FULL_60_16]OGV72595.1 MAG: aspartate aminotransferase [Lentisphaerae bacterium RIFOXYA12_FULL_60_10]OGV77283.1 MAG: aspartate aminotransferase [Lentisphaerae bacterium RIFOXYB12_FULL_60_10]
METTYTINERVAAIQPSLTLAITSRAKEMAATGCKVCSFAAGEPDFDTPEPIRNAAVQALARGETRYTPESGLLTLRQAVCAKLMRENGLSYEPDQVVISNGAKHSLSLLFTMLCRPGDEVIIPGPFWLSYPEMVNVAGGKPVPVVCAESSGFKLSPEKLESVITPRSKVLILNSPCNPTGIVYDESELRALVEVAVRHGLLIVSDEIYEKMVYDGVRHVSPASFSPETYAHTVTVNGFSKAFAMTGWRLGYLAAPRPLAKAAGALQSHLASAPNTFAQHGAVQALQGGDEAARHMVSAFEKRRNTLLERLNGIAGITCVRPSGAFYAFPNIRQFKLDSITFCQRLLEEKAVAAIPGKVFGSDDNIRLSYACSLEIIQEGMDRLGRFVASL